MGKPITNPITNPAPIEHGLVMDRRVHTYDAATLIAATAWRETLAANLAVGGALCAAYWQHGDRRRWDWRPGCGRAWGG